MLKYMASITYKCIEWPIIKLQGIKLVILKLYFSHKKIAKNKNKEFITCSKNIDY